MRRPSRIVFLVVSAVMLTLLSACGAMLDDQARLERAKQAYANGDMASATVDLKAFLQENPDHSEARLLLGEALFRAGDLQDAEGEFERGLELLRKGADPAAAEQILAVTAKLAALQLALREFGPALANAERLIADDPDNAAGYVIASQSAYYSGDNAAARSFAARLLARDPDAVLALAMLGFVDVRDGAHSEAEARFNTVLMREPGFHAVRFALTQLQIIMRKHDEAVATLAPLLVVAPTEVRLLELVDVMQLGSPEARARVEQVADEIESSNSASPVPGLLRGRAALLARDYDAASEQFRLAMAKGGGRYPLVGYSVSQRALGAVEPAQRVLQEWLESNPNDQAAGFMLASTYLDQGQSDAARSLYEKLVGTTEIDSPLVLNNLAWLYGESNDPRAIETARQAHQQAPENGAITDTLGWLLVKAGEYDEGIRMLRLASQQAPNSDEIRYHLATALAEAGQQGAAQEQLDLAGALNGDATLAPAREAGGQEQN